MFLNPWHSGSRGHLTGEIALVRVSSDLLMETTVGTFPFLSLLDSRQCGLSLLAAPFLLVFHGITLSWVPSHMSVLSLRLLQGLLFLSLLFK